MRSLAGLLLLALAAPALAADSILFDDGLWQVVGVDVAAESQPIAVSQDGEPLGDFAALRILYAQDAASSPCSCSVRAVRSS